MTGYSYTTLAGMIALVLATLYIVYWDSDPPETFRYKLTINVTVDGTPYSASSVIEATQTRKRALLNWSGSGAGGGLYPEFTARGVAPMIQLPDGAVIFASLRGFFSDNPPGGRGASAARLPWLIYVDEWWKDLPNRGSYTNLPVVRLPAETPRLEIPFDGHPNSRFRPPIWYVPPQELGPAMGTPISNENAQKVSGRHLSLGTFAIEPSMAPVIECLEDGPLWVAAYRGGPSVPKAEMERRRYDRNRPIDQQYSIHSFDMCPGRKSR